MEKVTIKLEDNWHGNTSETLWIEPVPNENLYQIRNIPFYAKNVSLDDIIEVKEFEGENFFERTIKKSGHSTYRIFLGEKTTDDLFKRFWMPLENIGCSFEKGYNRFYSIDVPNNTDIYKAYSLLEYGEKNKIWEFEEGNIGHDLK